MQEHSLIPFFYHNHPVRTMAQDDGSPWWVAADVCAILDLRNVSQACARLDEDERATISIVESGGPPHELLLVNEPGLYRLITRSRKKEAREFRRWVFHEVLPQIRKTGKYEPTSALERFPELKAIVELAQSTAEARILAEEAKAEAYQANANAQRALETQLFFTVAEYIYVYKMQAKLPESAYKACSDHLRLYCLDRNIPFRKTTVGGKRWDDEYAYHVSVYTEAFPDWLKRRFAQTHLRVLDSRDA